MPEPLAAPPDAAERIAVLDAFSGLPHATLEQLVHAATWLRFSGGEIVFREGERADAAYFIVRGRVRVTQTNADGDEHVVGERGVGEPIGEVGVLADVPRTATVRAVRDTDVVRIDRPTFDRLLRSDPATMVPLVEGMASRLAEALRGRAVEGRRVATVAVFQANRPADGDRVVDELVEALSRRVDVVRLSIGQDGEADDASQVVAAIDAQQARGGVTFLDIRAPASERAHHALRQADCVVVVADPAPAPLAGAADAALRELAASGCTPRRIMLLIQPQWRQHPVGTAPRVGGFDEHHHVRAGATADFARAARELTGDAVGLVLGGGGARAMSHVGAHRALVEAGVPIDRVGGSSIGGFMATQVARGWSPAEIEARNRGAWPGAHLNRRVTLPVVSLLSPEPALRMLDDMFGGMDMEDLWLPCFVTAVDLSQCRLVVSRAGSVRRWGLATQSPPGIWPPVVGDDGSLYVDGAVIDNLPVLPMRAAGAGRVLAISVSRQPTFAAGAAVDRAPSPLAFARNFTRPPAERAAYAFPNLLQVLYRTALVTGLERHGPARVGSDLYVEPSVDDFGIGDYARFDEIVPRGYDAMRAALDARPGLAERWS